MSSPAQVYAVNRCVTPHTLELISVTDDGSAAADAACLAPNISADGRYVAFVSPATNLPAPGSGQVGAAQLVFVRDRVAQTTLSPMEAWRQNSGGVGVDVTAAIRYMSADASRFAFDFRSPPAVEQNLYVVNFSAGATTFQPICPALDNACLAGTSDYMSISADGNASLQQLPRSSVSLPMARRRTRVFSRYRTSRYPKMAIWSLLPPAWQPTFPATPAIRCCSRI